MKYITGIVAVVALIIAIATALIHGSVSQSLGSATVTPTNYNNVTLSNQLVVGGADVRADGVGTPTPIALALTDLQGNSAIIENSATSTAYTLTFPATSTLSGWLPHAGDWTDIMFTNASTTGPTITIASSTGVDIKTSTTGTTASAVVAGAVANMRILRLTNQGNFVVQFGVTAR